MLSSRSKKGRTSCRSEKEPSLLWGHRNGRRNRTQRSKKESREDLDLSREENQTFCRVNTPPLMQRRGRGGVPRQLNETSTQGKGGEQNKTCLKTNLTTNKPPKEHGLASMFEPNKKKSGGGIRLSRMRVLSHLVLHLRPSHLEESNGEMYSSRKKISKQGTPQRCQLR